MSKNGPKTSDYDPETSTYEEDVAHRQDLALQGLDQNGKTRSENHRENPSRYPADFNRGGDI